MDHLISPLLLVLYDVVNVLWSWWMQQCRLSDPLQSIFFFFFGPGQSGTSLDVSDTGEIFIGTISLEQCCSERKKCHCWCDVFKFLSALTVSTGAFGVFYRRLRAKFLLSLCAHKTLAQGDAAEACSWRENVHDSSLSPMLTALWFVCDVL